MRWVVRAVVTLLVLVVVAVAALFLIPTERIARLAAQQFEAATGRAMVISGALRPTLWPRLGLRAGHVEIANAGWSKEGPLLSAEGLTIGVDPGVLFGGAIRVNEVTVTQPKIVLELGKDGHGNWEMAPAAAATGGSGAPAAAAPATGAATEFTLDLGKITGGSVTWIDHGAGTRTTLDGIDATLKVPDYAGAMTLSLAAALNGTALQLEAEAASFSTLMSGKVTPVTLHLAAKGADVDFKGRAGLLPFAAEGDLDTVLTDLGPVMRAVGQEKPALPKGLGSDRIGLSGKMTLAPEGTLSLRGARIVADGNTVTGDIDIDPNGARPKLVAQLSTDALDLSALGGGASAGGGGAAAGWSTDPIDASALNAMDASVAITAGALNLGPLRTGTVKVMTTIDRGRAVIDLRQISAYEGTITGQVVVNARSGLSTSADLSARGVALKPLLTALAGYDRLNSDGTLALKLLASGNSQDALVRSLSGTGSLSLGKGELTGLDLLGMLRTLDTSYVGPGAKTIFDSLTASWTITNGVLANDDLALKAPLLTASGKGKVDLGAQTLAYTVTPTALPKADGTGGITVPLAITGPWSKLSFALDLKSIADKKIDEQKKKLEDQAKAKAAEALGVTPDDGQSVEDAAKKKLEEEAKKGLSKLLGGN